MGILLLLDTAFCRQPHWSHLLLWWFFSRLMSLFLYLVVGSVGMELYVGCCNNSSAFLYSSVSMATNDTPLSAVKIILEESFFNSVMPFLSSFVMLVGRLYVFLMMVFTSPLNSSASPCCNLLHAHSIAATYSVTGGLLGTMAKFGPWANNFSYALVKGLLGKLITHLLVVLVFIEGLEAVFIAVVMWSPFTFDQPPLPILFLAQSVNFLFSVSPWSWNSLLLSWC